MARFETNYAYKKVQWGSRFSLRDFFKLAYGMTLCRVPKESDIDYWIDQVESSNMTPHFIFQHLVESKEYEKTLNPFHSARIELVKRLPTAAVIVDLGGSTTLSEEGALYRMGYEPKAKRLVIIDLPPSERHEDWKKTSDSEAPLLKREWGTIEYWYKSLAEVDQIEQAEFADLVWSGQSIEHITEEAGDRMLQGVHKMLRPGGHFCLDTPNRRVTQELLGGLSHPDHKLEYDHEQLSKKLERHGFEIVEALGVVDCSGVDRSKEFSIPEQMSCPTFTDDIEQGLFLYYHCTRL